MSTKAFELAKESFAAYGIDVEAAIEKLSNIPVSLHCWQGDDVGGFDNDGALTGGMAYEALNNAGDVDGNFIVVFILDDDLINFLTCFRCDCDGDIVTLDGIFLISRNIDIIACG